MFKNASGVITVFVSLMLIPLLAFGTLVMEAGRYLSARSLLAEAQTTAAMTVLANYNVYLNERFGLLTIDPEGADESHEDDYKEALYYNSDNVSGVSKPSQLYSFASDNDWSFETIYALSDYNVIKRQILEYSKYSVPYEVVSEKLGLDGIFGNLKEKLKLDEISSLLDNMSEKTSNAVNALELSFWEIGKVEYYNLDLQNFFGESNTKDNYNPEELYKEYIKKDKDFDSKGKPKSYNDSTNYNKRYRTYMDQVYAKSDYIDTNANPTPKYNAAVNARDNNSVFYSSKYGVYLDIYAVCRFLIEYKDSGEAYKVSNDKYYSVSYYKYSASISGENTYALSGGSNSVSLTKSSSASYAQRYVKTAINNMKSKLGKTSLTIDSYDALQDLLEDYLDYYGEAYSSTSSNFLATERDDAFAKVNSYYTSNSKESALNSLVDTWSAEKNTYDNKISGFNTAISNAKQGYIDALTSAVDKFSKYIEKLGTAYNQLEESKSGYADNFEDDNEEAKENVSKVTGKMDEVKAELQTEKTKAESAKALLEEIKSNVNLIDPSSMEDVSTDSGINKIEKIGENTKYVIGVENATLKGYVGLEGFTKIGEFCNESPLGEDSGSFDLKTVGSMAADALGISDLWNAFKAIGENLQNLGDSVENFSGIISPIPADADSSYDQVIQGNSLSLLPSFSSTESVNESDKAYAASMMENVGKVLGSAYNNQLSEITVSNAEKDDFISNLQLLKDSISDIFTDAASIRTEGILKIGTVIKEMIGDIVSAFTAVKNLVSNLFTLVESLVSAAWDAILINTYVVQKFPSRMTSVSDATVIPADTDCTNHNACYFNSCCVEYIFAGSDSETSNQSTVFWLIFGIRAIINCIQIALTPQTMSLVSACNVFAPLMFIALAYMETNIDMNYLVNAGESVPIWKDNIHMSVKGLLNLCKELIDIDNVVTVYKTTSDAGKRYHKSPNCRTLSRSVTTPLSLQDAKKEKLTGCAVCNPIETAGEDEDGYVPVTYDTYLYILLFFVGGDEKLKRVGKLIQLETRYYESKQKGGAITFKLNDAGTYVRSSANAKYNTLLPMFSLGGNSNGFPSIYSLKYTGY